MSCNQWHQLTLVFLKWLYCLAYHLFYNREERDRCNQDAWNHLFGHQPLVYITAHLCGGESAAKWLLLDLTNIPKRDECARDLITFKGESWCLCVYTLDNMQWKKMWISLRSGWRLQSISPSRQNYKHANTLTFLGFDEVSLSVSFSSLWVHLSVKVIRQTI